MKEIFKRLIVDFFRREINTKPREYNIPLTTNKIVSLVGIRRSGKTYILYNLIKKLRENLPRENIVYINFEDDRIAGVKLENLDEFIEGYYELYPSKRREKVYLFLDEVQEVENWEKFIRRIYDTLNVSIYLTGSSSKLMSKEIASSLRGRTIVYEIFPLSFKEFLMFKGIEIDLYSSESISYIRNSLGEYIQFGGFPEIALEEEEDIRRRILSGYSDLIVYKDVAERFNIKNLAVLKNLIRHSFYNPATSLSFGKLFNQLKTQGHKLSKETLINYFTYLNDCYAIFLIPTFKKSIQEQNRNPKKLYIIDNGFKTINTPAIETDFSKLFENTVFLNLRRQFKEIFYILEEREVDFFVPEKELLINVCYDLSVKETFEREIQSLQMGLNSTKLKEGLIITSELEKEFQVGKHKIKILPLWKWLLLND